MNNTSQKPLKINFLTQNPNEEVYYLLRKDFITNAPWIITLVLCLIVPIVFLPFGEDILFWPTLTSSGQITLLIFWYLCCFGFGLVRIAKWYYHVFLITDSRVLDVDLVGFLYRNVAEAQLQHLQDVTHTQGGLLQLIFNFGNVYVQTAATRQDIELLSVPEPGIIHDIITDLAAIAHKNQPVPTVNDRNTQP
ncbi:PH domain-containing protein [Patescibacteria group bacterium]|nr:PH domain-containing protein [Patescibacteria group bacterium]MBU1868335.1 PH domain-containing protein [Patescibacteria group bacterium]